MRKKTSRFLPMPEVFFDEVRERQAREKVEVKLNAVRHGLAKIRENGVTIANETELKAFTPEAVKRQIDEVKQRRLGERFLPQSIRNQEAAAFARLEAAMVREADDLQETLKGVPFPIIVGETAEATTFDGNAVEDYIEQSANVEIPPFVRDYYAQLVKVCEAWDEFTGYCSLNGFHLPTRRVLNMLAGEGDPSELVNFNITPEKMFAYYTYIGLKAE